MIRDKPSFVLALAEAAGAALPDGATATSLGEAVAPVRDYLPDAAVAIHDGRGALDRVVIVEVQLRRREDKAFSLPVYQALARARHPAPCEVLVVTPALTVATWLATPIELGGGSLFRALVVGPDELLRLDAARRRATGSSRDAQPDVAVEIAFLRAVAHGRHDLQLVTSAGLLFDAKLPDDRAALYFDVILDVLPISKRRALESFMEKERLKFRSEFMRNLVKEGLEKGLEKGLAKGHARGLEEGRVEGLRGALRAILDAREIQLSTAQTRQLERCEDPAVLDAWVQRAARATTADDVFPSPPRKARAPAPARARRTRGSAK